MGLSKERDGSYGFVIVVAAFLSNMIWSCGLSSFGVLYPEFLDYFQTSNTLTAWISSVQTLTYGCSGMFVGALVKRFGIRRIGVVGSIVMATGFFISVFSPNIYYLFPAYGIITGLGSMMVFNPAIVAIQTFFEKKRGMANAAAMIGTSMSIFAWPPLVQYLINRYTWRGTLLIMSSVILHGVPLALMYVEVENKSSNLDIDILNEDIIPKSCSRKCKGVCSSIFGLAVWKNPGFVLQALCYFCISFTYYLILNFIPARALSIGIEKYPAAFLISILGMANTFARVFVAFILDRNKVSRPYMFIACTMCFGFITVTIPFLDEYPTLVVGMIIAGFFMGCTVCIQPLLLVDIVGLQNIAPAVGYTMAFVGVAALIGTTFAGFIADVTGGYTLQFHIYGSATAFGGFLMLLLPLMNKCKRNQEAYDVRARKFSRGQMDVYTAHRP